MHDTEAETIRLNAIDCPEKRQPWGSKAKEFTAGLCFGKEVTVEAHGKDRYRRTIADLILPDGKNLSAELVRAGYAWWYRRFAPDNTELQKLEQEAREAKRGLWQDDAAIPPWQFRRMRKSGGKQNNTAQHNTAQHSTAGHVEQ